MAGITGYPTFHIIVGMDKLPSGTFTITAYNQDEEPAQGTAVINNTTEMKTKLKGNVECNNAEITATFNKVEGATDYLVVLKKIIIFHFI